MDLFTGLCFSEEAQEQKDGVIKTVDKVPSADGKRERMSWRDKNSPSSSRKKNECRSQQKKGKPTLVSFHRRTNPSFHLQCCCRLVADRGVAGATSKIRPASHYVIAWMA